MIYLKTFVNNHAFTKSRRAPTYVSTGKINVQHHDETIMDYEKNKVKFLMEYYVKIM